MSEPFCHRCGRNNAYCACVSIKEEIEAERAKVAKLREALYLAIDDIGNWAAYADKYYHDKWDLKKRIDSYWQILDETK